MTCDGCARSDRDGRVKVAFFSPEALVAWMQEGRIPELVLLSERLPEDAVIVGCGFNSARQQVAIMIESREYELVPVGRPIPEVETPQWGVKVGKEA